MSGGYHDPVFRNWHVTIPSASRYGHVYVNDGADACVKSINT